MAGMGDGCLFVSADVFKGQAARKIDQSTTGTACVSFFSSGEQRREMIGRRATLPLERSRFKTLLEVPACVRR